MSKSSKLYVGMDVHKDSIDVATGDDAAGEVRHYGAIGGEMEAVSRLARKLESTGKVLVFVYEAGPCGFGIYRMLRDRGHECWVVSPGMTPRSNADRVKTDRRDCLKLARLARAGELTPIHVPDEADEAMRDLVRAREDAVVMQRQWRHSLEAGLGQCVHRVHRRTCRPGGDRRRDLERVLRSAQARAPARAPHENRRCLWPPAAHRGVSAMGTCARIDDCATLRRRSAPPVSGCGSARSSKTCKSVTHVLRHFCYLSPRPLTHAHSGGLL